MKRWRELPVGVELGGSGARFRLWAPSARRVTLSVAAAGGDLQADLDDAGDGWFELTVGGLDPGATYRYRIDGEIDVPDPASRFNPHGVQGPSQIIDPREFQWTDAQWRGRPWQEAVIYEMHIGAFTPEGDYAAATRRLDELRDFGVTALEIMPIAAFPGRRGWGYDGVLHYAPHAAYGSPDDLKRFVQAAHASELMVLLDVVYNHFGPEGNYLGRYAREFFTARHRTPWGDAINFEHPLVRQFFIENALYWLQEYHFDGLRIDAVHAMQDDSAVHFIDELIAAVQDGPGRERHVHVVLENHNNEARRLKSKLSTRPLPDPPPQRGGGTPGSERRFDAPSARTRGEGATAASAFDKAVAQWNDDSHHALHVLITGEKDGYYVDYADRTLELLGKILTQGFAYQGERSKLSGKLRGEPSAQLSALSFVDFLQNHDQIGNRAFGERIAQLAPAERVRAVYAILLLSPHIPMLFMGEEYAAAQPFLYFCDYEGELAEAVRNGRRAEFAGFAAFADAKVRETIPDPNARETFERSRLAWDERERAPHAEFLAYIAQLLRIRAQHVAPRSADVNTAESAAAVVGRVLEVRWPLHSGGALLLRANFSDARASLAAADAEVLFPSKCDPQTLAPWQVRLVCERAADS